MGGTDFKGGRAPLAPRWRPPWFAVRKLRLAICAVKLEMLRSFKYILLTQEFDAQSLEILSRMNTCDENIFGMQIG